MVRSVITAVLAGLVFVSTGMAQTAGWRFQWQSGQVLTYKAEQTMTATEVIDGKTSATSQKVVLVTRWQVTAVDAAGIATVRKSIVSMRIEQTAPRGEVLVFDSAAPDKSDPQLREQLTPFVGTPLAILRLDGRGQVVEVKECKHGKASQYEVELPFVVMLPETVPAVGQKWERPFTVTLDPPEGTGEKYEASQTYACKSLQGNLATFGLTTAFKALPKASADQAPLLQLRPEGEIVFDTKAGRVRSVKLSVIHDLKDHQGEGSSISFRRTCTEEYVGD